MKSVSNQALARKISKNGFSIIEVLVAIGIMSFVSIGIATLITNQSTNIQALDEKMAMQNIQTQVMNVLSSTTYCKCFIGATRTFDYSGTQTWNSFPTSVAGAFDAACAPLGGAFLTVGTPYAPKLTPTGLTLQNITETVAGSGNFSANLQITFDQSLLTRSRKNLNVPMYFTLNMGDPASARHVNTCAAVAASAFIDLSTLCGDIGGVYNAAATPKCQPTYQ